MSRPPIFISDLQKGNHVWKMSIRVVDVWIVKERNGQQHVEMVIEDSKGHRIQVTTKNRDYKNWTEKVTEFQTYVLYNAEPLDNDFALKVCDNDLKLLLTNGTTLSKSVVDDFPPHKYHFKPVMDFLTGSFKVDHVYDVIGVLHDVLRARLPVGGKKACANITIADECGNLIDVVLWEAYGTQLIIPLHAI